jgi:hypothetical protein
VLAAQDMPVIFPDPTIRLSTSLFRNAFIFY